MALIRRLRRPRLRARAPVPVHARPAWLSSATSASTRRAPCHHAGSVIRKGCRMSVCAPAPPPSSGEHPLRRDIGRQRHALLAVGDPKLLEALHQQIGVDKSPIEGHGREAVLASPPPTVGRPPVIAELAQQRRRLVGGLAPGRAEGSSLQPERREGASGIEQQRALALRWQFCPRLVAPPVHADRARSAISRTASG